MKTKQILVLLGIIVFLGASSSCVRSSSKCKKDYKKVRKNNNARK